MLRAQLTGYKTIPKALQAAQRSKALLIFLALSTLLGFAFAQTVQIGNGNLLRQGLPIKPYFDYSYSQQLYYATEIGSPGLITGISFQYDVHDSYYYQNNCQFRVWMTSSPRTAFSTWMDPDSLSLVFQGHVSQSAYSGGLPGTGWMYIALDTPFDYTQQSNLIIAVKEESPGRGNTSDDFFCTSHPAARGITCSALEDFAIGEFPANSTYVRQAHANLRLHMISTQMTPIQPSPAHNAINVPLDTGFSWLSVASSFDFYFGSQPNQLQLLQSNLTQPSFSLSEPLQMLQRYYWQVVAHHDGNTYTGDVWSFFTCGEQIDPPQNFQAWFQDGSVHLSWNPPQIGNACEYLIYKDELLVANTSQYSYIDSDVIPGNTYSYYLKARNQQNQLSDPTPTLQVSVPYIDPNCIIFQDFEAMPLWSSEIPGWTVLDLDGSLTWQWENYSFPHSGEPCGWMVFSPSFTTPPHNFLEAYSGIKMLMSPDATNPPDNNWLISPSVYLGVNPSVGFWARSLTDHYGLERLKVLISTGGTDPGNFTTLHSTPWLNIPAAWTYYEYDLSAYQNQSVRLAWQAVSNDAMALFLDDIEIKGTGGYVGNCDELTPAARLRVSPNPSTGEFSIQGIKGRYELTIYDIKGRKIHRSTQQEGSKNRHPKLANGIYIVQVKQADLCLTAKLVICK